MIPYRVKVLNWRSASIIGAERVALVIALYLIGYFLSQSLPNSFFYNLMTMMSLLFLIPTTVAFTGALFEKDKRFCAQCGAKI